MKVVKKAIRIGTLSLCLIGMFAACSSKKGDVKAGAVANEQKKEKVKVMRLEKRIVERVGEYMATLKAWDEVHLAPASPGRIDKISVEVSDVVKEGQTLVEMDQTQLMQAEIQLKNIETEFKRADILFKAGSYSAQAHDQLKTQYEVAQTNVSYLKTNTRLKAPFPGVISGKYFENGEMYSGTPIQSVGKAAVLSLVRIDQLKAIFGIPESYFPTVKKGMKAKVFCDTYKGKEFSGEIDIKYPVISESTRSFEIELRVPNQQQLLRPGMFARVSLNLGKEETCVVPDYVVLKMQGTNERYVFVNENGVAKRVLVQIGQRFDDYVEILSENIKEGMEIVCEGQARLLDKSPLEIVK